MIRFYYENNAVKPYKKHWSDGGYDIRSKIDVEVKPMEKVVIPTGLTMEIPYKHVGIIKERSSFALKGIVVIGGVIDSEYRGEVKVIMLNLGEETLQIKAGDRIAQILVVSIALTAELLLGKAEVDTKRGAKGFGSTGVR
ncbi:dUTP pyrophosphatase [Marinitoga hydrogenitolerans DSM 16785]|uniref:dUTP diphosphatase n=1 Tax=Marinitoga hydrogenitolerans (strain DSM 16785 / JCM 12826 / AT1271) TaxID=1122195 RepID=A0A1M4TT35_MARH1|nr:dUTP diphosphatase [Marinitoga hydrogenitolerans]SHE47477.1 dUTP pyrophosphatase [Marinitoga hydrogenitolerans DSM 16785]